MYLPSVYLSSYLFVCMLVSTVIVRELAVLRLLLFCIQLEVAKRKERRKD